jgi:hypothetical protein
MRFLSVLDKLPRCADCALNLFLFGLEGRAADIDSRQDQAWKIDYRTAGGFHCLYVGAPTAWCVSDWALPALDQGEQSLPVPLRCELSRGSSVNDVAWCLPLDIELLPGVDE